MPIIAILRTLKQEDFEFDPNLAIEQLLSHLGYTLKSCAKH